MHLCYLYFIRERYFPPLHHVYGASRPVKRVLSMKCSIINFTTRACFAITWQYNCEQTSVTSLEGILNTYRMPSPENPNERQITWAFPNELYRSHILIRDLPDPPLGTLESTLRPPGYILELSQGVVNIQIT